MRFAYLYQLIIRKKQKNPPHLEEGGGRNLEYICAVVNCRNQLIVCFRIST